MTNNSRIGDEFEQWIRRLILLTTYFVPIHPLSGSWLVKFASQIYHEDTNTPLDGVYLADFGIDIILVSSSPALFLSHLVDRVELFINLSDCQIVRFRHIGGGWAAAAGRGRR